MSSLRSYQRFSLLAAITTVALFVCTSVSLHAQVTMDAQDTLNESSFNTAGHWSDELAPSSGKSYETSFTLRTPVADGSYTFGGDSLRINSGGQLFYKGVDGNSITANLIMNGGFINNGTSSTFTLNGTLSLTSSASKFFVTTEKVTVNSLISGASDSPLTLGVVGISSTDLTGGLVLTNSSNSFAGGIILQNYASLEATADGVLGTGDVELRVGSFLTLHGGTTNDYIDDSASLILDTDAYQVLLDYTGTDTIAGLSVDGGSTYLDFGIYGAIGSGAEYELSVLSGTGTFTVIPEPSSISFGLLALLSLAACQRYRRK